MLDPSLFTGRYDDGLCAALGDAGHEVSLLARPMRATDAIEPKHYTYVPRFFARSERLRGALGEGTAFRALKAAEYLASASIGAIANLCADDVVHMQWLPFPLADRRLIARLRKGRKRPALVHTVHNASAYHGDSGAQGEGYRLVLDQFDAPVRHRLLHCLLEWRPPRCRWLALCGCEPAHPMQSGCLARWRFGRCRWLTRSGLALR